jgi:hypothetical protein
VASVKAGRNVKQKVNNVKRGKQNRKVFSIALDRGQWPKNLQCSTPHHQVKKFLWTGAMTKKSKKNFQIIVGPFV